MTSATSRFRPVALDIAFIVIPAARSFLANGQPSVLMLDCGILMMDLGVVAMPFAFARSSDTAFAIYNTSVLLAARSRELAWNANTLATDGTLRVSSVTW